MNINCEVIGTCTIGYICDSNKYNKFVAKHKKIKKLYVHILHYECHPTPPRTSPPHPQAQVMSSKLICLINACI